MNYSFHGLRLSSTIPLPELRRTGPSGDVAIDLGGPPDESPRDWFHTWPLNPRARGGRGRAWLSFARLSGGYLLRFHDLCDFEVRDGGRRITCHPVCGLAAPTLRHLLIDQVLPLVLSQRGRLVLHASAVHVDGVGTVAFAGRTGAGKSTLAAAIGRRTGCAVVTDDCLVIVPQSRNPHSRAAPSGALLVVPGYAGIRLWPDSARALRLANGRDREVAHYTPKRRVGERLRFRTRPTRLRALFVLGRRRPAGKPTSARRLRRRAAFLELAEFAYLMDIADRDQLSGMFRQLATVVERVPVLRLSIRDGWREMGRTAGEVLALTPADS